MDILLRKGFERVCAGIAEPGRTVTTVPAVAKCANSRPQTTVIYRVEASSRPDKGEFAVALWFSNLTCLNSCGPRSTVCGRLCACYISIFFSPER